MSKEGLCASCSNSIRCNTWAEWKCTVEKRRIYETVTKCESYVKRPKNWKEMKCHCKDCLANEKLLDELDEESEDLINGQRANH